VIYLEGGTLRFTAYADGRIIAASDNNMPDALLPVDNGTAVVAEVFALSKRILADVKPGTYYSPRLIHTKCAVIIRTSDASFEYQAIEADNKAPACPEALRQVLVDLGELTAW